MPEPNTTNAPKPETRPYRLKEGMNHFVRVPGDEIGIKPVRAGGTVQLTAAQAKAWRDKFEPVGDPFPAEAESFASDESKGDDKDKDRKDKK